MNRSVLIVTPYFAPQSHAAAFRAYKLAKYLPRFGWKPYVVTVDTNYLYNEDSGLLAALAPEVEIHTARYVEPSLRGFRMALGGKDRSFVAIKHEALQQCAAGARNGDGRSPARFVYQYVLERWLRNPDAYWTWRTPAIRAARRLIRQFRIPLVFTSADPYTSHLIGLALQGEGCRWVADLRDPHAYNARTSSVYARVYARQRAAERAAVTRADAVTVAAEAIAMIVCDMYGLGNTSRIHFIPTGLDEGLLPESQEVQTKPWPYLLFSGEFLQAYGTEFLEVFAQAMTDAQVAALGHRLIFAGRLEVNRARVLPTARRLGIEERVEFVDHMPQQQLYRLLLGAQAAVLVSSRRFGWWCLHAKMVDYIALRKPVLAVLPDPGEARTRLTHAGLGIFLDGTLESCTRTLTEFLTGRLDTPSVNDEECGKYTASCQVRAFTQVFEEVITAA